MFLFGVGRFLIARGGLVPALCVRGVHARSCIRMPVGFSFVCVCVSVSVCLCLFPPSLCAQIEFLFQCRPHSLSMGNAVRYVKAVLAKLPKSMSGEATTHALCAAIDRFVDERLDVHGALLHGAVDTTPSL